MVATNTNSSLQFPDDPRKWDGWSKYRSSNPYERLCLDPRSHPTDEQIQLHCAALLQWWKHKLPLKNQPSNPLAQLLGRGIDESSRYLIHARIELLDPERRQAVDHELSLQAHQEAFAEFEKFVGFSISNGRLTAEAEANLIEFGQRNGVTDEQIQSCIENQLQQSGGRRIAATESPVTPAPTPTPERPRGNAEYEFDRILRLSSLELSSATYSVRAVFAAIAENLGIELQRAEDLLDAFLENQELALAKMSPEQPTAGERDAVLRGRHVTTQTKRPAQPSQVAPPTVRPTFPRTFANPVCATMILIPAGEFVMGSDATDAPLNEQPLTPVRLKEFYISQFPVTNTQYEQFDTQHRQKRIAGDDHPVVHVSSIDALNFCRWLGEQDGKKYRLPTEAEWEFAARGPDGRKYPWGNHSGRADLANFADASTTFPWRDANLNDGYAETSPVGAFPLGASFFGLHDMAGNVWEWCLDYFQPLAGTPRQNPRGAQSGTKRVYRGGSWKSRFANLRATARACNAANYSCNDLGFRVVCECEPPDAQVVAKA
ncbi:MAG: formylglycine-generating enzyme family protein [Chthoniobacterales bacterium]